MERSKSTKTSKERQEKVTIYFDKRALEQQKKEGNIIELKNKKKFKKNPYRKKKFYKKVK